MLYLSDRAIAELVVPPKRLREALGRAYRLHAERRTLVKPKLGLSLAPGHLFQALCAASAELGFAGAKWVGLSNANAARGLPLVSSLVVLSDYTSGVPVALLDGNLLTVLRTAAMSALAAASLATPASRSIGFLGCGRQAEGHLHAFRSVLSSLDHVTCSSRSPASAEHLAGVAQRLGLSANVGGPEDLLACDVVVTSVPEAEVLEPVLDASRLKPGAFVAAPDLARSWHPASLAAFDVLAIDDRDQAADPSTRARLPVHDFAADLAELAAQPGAQWRSPGQRALFLFPGHALADLAVAAEILTIAREAGAGQVLR